MAARESSKAFLSLPLGFQILSGSNLTQSKCQSSDSRLPDPTHLCPQLPLMPSSLLAPFPTSCQNTDLSAFLCICQACPGSRLLHTFTSLSGSVYPQINCFFISFRVGLKSSLIWKTFTDHPEVGNKLLPILTLYPPYMPYLFSCHFPPPAVLSICWFYCLPFLDRHRGGRLWFAHPLV